MGVFVYLYVCARACVTPGMGEMSGKELSFRGLRESAISLKNDFDYKSDSYILYNVHARNNEQ